MKSIFGIAMLGLVGAVGWRIGGALDSEALGMAVGMLFGIMAGIPTALLVLASERRGQETRREWERERPHRQHRHQIEVQPPAPPAQIVHNHVHYHAAPTRDRRAEVEARHMLPGLATDWRDTNELQ